MRKRITQKLSLAAVIAAALTATVSSCTSSNSGNRCDASTSCCPECPVCCQDSATIGAAKYFVFATERITVEKSLEFKNQTSVTFSAIVDYPQDCNEKAYKTLNDKVRLLINNELIGRGECVTNRDVVSESANQYMNHIRSSKGNRDNNQEYGKEKIITIQKIFEDKDFLTYEIYNYGYDGGAHGSNEKRGITFVKKDGSQIGWENIRKTEDLQKQMTQSVADKYEKDLDEFMNMVQAEPDKLPDGTSVLPWPNAAPYLSEGGWTFIYQPYEIMSYADGTPIGVVARDKVEFQK